jgi:CO/xanthine dehydrogenase FAD-binding subunit
LERWSLKFDVFLPDSLPDLLRFIDKQREEVSLIAGGTDLLPRLIRGQARPKLVVNLSNLSELSFLKKANGTYRIGALTRISELPESTLFQNSCEAVREVCRQLASPPIRNLATVGGNIAGPGSFRDLLLVLLCLGARAVLKSRRRERVLPIENLMLEDGTVGLGREEVLTEVQLQELPENSWSSFSKVGRRQGFAIPLVSSAMFLQLELPSKRVRELRLWFNHLRDSIPEKAEQTAAAVRGELLSERVVTEASGVLSAELRPSSDFRASSEYRRRAAVKLFMDQLAHCAEMIVGSSR